MLKMIIGSAWGHKFSFFEADRSTPMDLSNRTVKVILKKNKDDADESAILTQTFVNPEVNYVIPTFTATDTHDIKEGNYYFSIKIYTVDDLDRELYNDVLTVNKGVFND